MTPPGSRPIRTILLLLAVLAAALAVRLIFVRTLGRDIYWPDSREYHVLALEMRHSWAYRDASGTPVVYWPPGYPYFLGAIYRAFGPSVPAVRAVQSVLGALTCILVYLIAVRLLDRRSALLAAALSAIYPLTVYTAGTLYPAALETFLLACVVLLCLVARERWSGPTLPAAGIAPGVGGGAAGSSVALGPGAPMAAVAAAAGAGVVAGCSALLVPSVLPALLLAAAWLAWPFSRTGLRRRLILAVVFLIPLALAIGGWSYRNYKEFGRPIAVSANGGFNFWLGNHPDVTAATGNRMTPRMKKELGAVYAKHRNAAARDSVLYGIGLQYVKSDPVRFVTLSAAKAVNFWRLYPQPMTDVQPAAGREKLLSILSYGLLLPFGMVWLVRSLRRSDGARLVLLIFIAYTLVHSVFISKVRFRIPLDPYVVVFASGALIALLDRVRRRSGDSQRSHLS